MKNPLKLAGIEPATFRFVAQHLNHCATAPPSSFRLYAFKNARNADRIFVKFGIEGFHEILWSHFILVYYGGCSVQAHGCRE